MKKMKRKRLILFVFLLFVLNGCSRKQTFTDEIAVDTLSSDLRAALSDTEFLTADPGYLDDYVQLPSSLHDFQICIAADGNNLNEFGIWHTDSGESAAAKNLLQTYLSDSLRQNRAFYDSYIPQETPKLRNAEIRVYGNYVAYAILNEPDRKTFFDVLEKRLSE